MKINFIILALMLGSFCASAQTTITRSDYQPVDGETYGYYSSDTSTTEGNSGANILWDYSNITQGSFGETVVTYCNGNGECTLFPGSNYFIDNGGTKTFYAEDTNGIQVTGERVGDTINNNAIVYTNQQRILKFPMTYLGNFSDTFSTYYTVFNPPHPTSNGSKFTLIDGYGTLKTPLGTYTNVLREKVKVDIIYDPILPWGHQIEEDYLWYQAGTSHQIMYIINIKYVNDQSTNIYKYVSYTNSSPKNMGGTSVSSLNTNTSFNIFPNPTNAFFRIKFESQMVNNISIKDLLGKTIFTKEINSADSRNNTIDVNTSGWAKGIYLVEAATANGSLIKKIVVE